MGRTEEQSADLQARSFGLKRSLFKNKKEIESTIDLSNELPQLLMQLEYKGRKAILRTFSGRSFWPTQMNVAGAVRKLVRDSIPRVVFAKGHFERSPWKYGEREYALHTAYKGSSKSLVNAGVEVDSVLLMDETLKPGADLLVIADPKSALSVEEQEKVAGFLKQGGNALFYAEPGKQEMLNPLLHQIGVHVEPGVLINLDSRMSPDEVANKINTAGNAMAREDEMQKHFLDSKFFAAGLFTSAGELSWKEIDGFRVEPISVFEGKPKVWREIGYQGLDSARATFSAADGDVMKEGYPMALKLSRHIHGKEQRIVVVADADFMSFKNHNGHTIGVGFYSWLLNNEYPVYKTKFLKTDKFLTIGKKAGNLIWNLYVYILPGLLLLAGLILVIRRSRR